MEGRLRILLTENGLGVGDFEHKQNINKSANEFDMVEMYIILDNFH